MSSPSAAVETIRKEPELFSYGVSRVWHPRGLIYSVLLHAAAVLALCFGPLAYPNVYWPPRRPMQLTVLDTSKDEVLLLPNLGGGSPGLEGGGAPAGGSRGGGEAGPVGKRGTGVIYKGPQPIVSNPPNPDNNLQTIRQPELINPPRLKFPIQAPDMVMLARSNAPAPLLAAQPHPPEPPPPPQVVRHNLGTANVPVPITAEPVAPRPELSDLATLRLPTPAAPNGKLEGLNASPTPPAPPSADPPREATASGSSGNDEHDLVVLNAIKSSLRAGNKLPAMEEYGAFIVSPNGGASTGQTGTGLEKTGPPGTGGSGTVAGAGTGTSSGTGKNGTGVGTGTGTGTGTGNGSGPGTGLGKGTGTGTGVGPGSGTGKGGPGAGGVGTGTGSGRGPGSGPGGGPFAGISIQGGSTRGGTRGGGGTRRGPGGSYSYGMTIIASAGSGGGLKDFGVFRNEVSYTVYINTSEPGQPRGDWTLQYAVIPNSSPASSAADPPAANPGPPARAMVAPPFALSKQMPHFPAQLAAENAGRQIVVSAVISAEGKVQEMRILQTPNALLNTAVMEALGKWVFRPAEVNGAPVAVKALLGIPVTAR